MSSSMIFRELQLRGSAADKFKYNKFLPVRYIVIGSDIDTIVSCYLTHNVDSKTNRSTVEALEDVVRETEGNVDVAGDFNAKTVGWVKSWTKVRGCYSTNGCTPPSNFAQHSHNSHI